MKTPKGMFVPVVTPFREDQSIDFDAFKEVIDYVLGFGLDGILIAGSTGEYHTMTADEQKEVIKKGIEFVNARVPVMAGIGRYTAKETVDFAKFAGECGATWGLVLPPYYQPTTDENVIEFFIDIADNSPIGIVIYNNPFSTGVELQPELLAVLAKHPNIVSLKDTSDMVHTSKTIALTREIPDFTVFQGYEHTILPALAIGAAGGFAILMNALPKEYVKLYDLVKRNKWEEAAEFSMNMANLYTAMEAEPYPAPVKAMMRFLGVPGGLCRKPLPDASDALKASMKEELIKLGYNL